MNVPHYDFGPGPLTPEMLAAALLIRLNVEVVKGKHALLVFEAAKILGVADWASTSYYENLESIADQVLLAWPEP